jgi:hypothetical protein
MSARIPVSFVDFVESVCSIRFEPGQRVWWGIAADDWQPKDLKGDDRELAREMLGDVEEIPESARREVALIKGAGVGYSFFLGLRLLHRAVTASELGAVAEIRPALAVAPDLRLGRVPVRNALGVAESVPEIRRLIESQTADGFVIRREGGRKTSVEALPASAGGRALRGRRYVEVGFDESAFFRDNNGYAINDVDCKRAVFSRCLGKFWNGSTPWLETADVWKTFETNFGNPTTALAMRVPTLLVRNDPRMVELVSAESERDPYGAATEYDCKPPVGAASFLDGYAITLAAVDDMPLVQEASRDVETFTALDAGFVSDSTGGAIVHRHRDGRIVVAEVFERRPEKGKPLVPSVVLREFAAVAKRHRATRVWADGHYLETVREYAREAGLTLLPAPSGHTGKAEIFGTARELLHAGKVSWSAGHSRLTQQAREVISRPMSGGGTQILQPRRKGSGHGDILSAAVLAIWAARHRRRRTVMEALRDPATLMHVQAMSEELISYASARERRGW